MSKSMKIFLLVAGAAVGLVALAGITGIFTPAINSAITWLNEQISGALGGSGAPQIPTF